MAAIAMAGSIAGDGCADCVDPCLPRRPFLAAHQGLVRSLAALVSRLGSSAADLGALRLCRGGQSGAARRQQPTICETIARRVEPDRAKESRDWSDRAYRLSHLPGLGVGALFRARPAWLALPPSPAATADS